MGNMSTNSLKFQQQYQSEKQAQVSNQAHSIFQNQNPSANIQSPNHQNNFNSQKKNSDKTKSFTPNQNHNKKDVNQKDIFAQQQLAQNHLSQFAQKSLFSQYKQPKNQAENQQNIIQQEQDSNNNKSNNTIVDFKKIGNGIKNQRNFEEKEQNTQNNKTNFSENYRIYNQIINNKEKIRTPKVQNQKIQSIIDRLEITKETQMGSRVQNYSKLQPIIRQQSAHHFPGENFSPQKQKKNQNQNQNINQNLNQKETIPFQQTNKKRTKSRYLQSLYEKDQQKKINEEKNKKNQLQTKKAKAIKDNLKSFETPSLTLAPIQVQQSSQLQYQNQNQQQQQEEQNQHQQNSPHKYPAICFDKILDINFDSPIEHGDLRHKNNKRLKTFIEKRQSFDQQYNHSNNNNQNNNDDNILNFRNQESSPTKEVKNAIKSDKLIQVQNSPDYREQLYQNNLRKALEEEEEEEEDNQSEISYLTSTFNSKSLNSFYKNTFDSNKNTNSDPSSNLTSSMKKKKLFHSEGTQFNSTMSKQGKKFILRKTHSDDCRWYKQKKFFENKQLNQVIKDLLNQQSFSQEKTNSGKKSSNQNYENKQIQKYIGKIINKRKQSVSLSSSKNKPKWITEFSVNISNKKKIQQKNKEQQIEFKRQRSNYLNILKFDDKTLKTTGICEETAQDSQNNTPTLSLQQKSKIQSSSDKKYFFQDPIEYKQSSQEQPKENSVIQEEDSEEDQDNEKLLSCPQEQNNLEKVKQIENYYNLAVEEPLNNEENLSSTRNFKSITPNMDITFKIRTSLQQISLLTGQSIKNTLQIFTENPQQNWLNQQEIFDILTILQINERQELMEILKEQQIEKILIDDLIKIYDLDFNQTDEEIKKNHNHLLRSPTPTHKNSQDQQQQSDLVDQTTLYFKEQVKMNNNQLAEQSQSNQTQLEEVLPLTPLQILEIKNYLSLFDQQTVQNPKNSEKIFIRDLLPDIIASLNDYIRSKKKQLQPQPQPQPCFLSDSNIKTIEFNSQLLKEKLKKKKILSQTPNCYPQADQVLAPEAENYLRSYQLQVRSSPINIQSNLLANSPCQNQQEEPFFEKKQGYYSNYNEGVDDILNIDNNTLQQTPCSYQFFNDNKIVLLEDIKKGGQGDIKSGFCLESKQMLAIKTFKNEADFRNEEMLYTFVQEQNLEYLFLKLISKDSNHPYKLIMERGACDLMQYIQLRNKIDKQPLKKEEILYIFLWLTQAEKKLIESGIYFSDIKPDNILLQYNKEDHTILNLYLTDLGGAYNLNENDDDFQYPNCITKFYFPLEFISTEIVNKKQNITTEQMAQCEMYQIARTIQVCLYPNYKSEIMQKKNINQFFDQYTDFLGAEICELLKKCLNFDKIKHPFTNLDQLHSSLKEIIDQKFPNFQHHIVNQSNNIKEWQDRLVKEKQDWSSTSMKELKQQSIFYEKIKLYRNQENVLKEISKRLKDSYEKSNSSKEKTKVLNYTVKNLIALGMNLQNQGKYDISFKYYNQAKEISSKLSKQKNETFLVYYGDCLNLIGGILQKKGKLAEALEHFLRALEHFNGIFRGETIQSADVYINIGYIYISMGRIDLALNFYQKALKIKLQIYENELHPDLATIYLGFGVCYINQDRLDAALEHYNLCVTIFQENNMTNTVGYADTLNNLGNIYYQKQNLPQALKLYKQSLKIQQQLLGINHINTALTLRNIGVIQKQFENYDKALELFFKALQIKLDHYDKLPHFTIGDTYIQIASTYLIQNKIELAYQYFSKAYEIRIQCYGETHQQTLEALSYKNDVQELIGKVNNMMSSSGKQRKISIRYSAQKSNNTQKEDGNIFDFQNFLQNNSDQQNQGICSNLQNNQFDESMDSIEQFESDSSEDIQEKVNQRFSNTKQNTYNQSQELTTTDNDEKSIIQQIEEVKERLVNTETMASTVN